MSSDVAITIATLAGVLILLLSGFRAYRLHNTPDGFFYANRKLWPQLGGFATQFFTWGLFLLYIAPSEIGTDGIGRIGLFFAPIIGFLLAPHLPQPSVRRYALFFGIPAGLCLAAAAFAAGSEPLIQIFGMNRNLAIAVLLAISAILALLDGSKSLAIKAALVGVLLIGGLLCGIRNIPAELTTEPATFSLPIVLQDVSWAFFLPASALLLPFRVSQREHGGIYAQIGGAVWLAPTLLLTALLLQRVHGTILLNTDNFPYIAAAVASAAMILVPAATAEGFALGPNLFPTNLRRKKPWLSRICAFFCAAAAAVLAILLPNLTAADLLFWGMSLAISALAPAMLPWKKPLGWIPSAAGFAVCLTWNFLLQPLTGIWGVWPGICAHIITHILLSVTQKEQNTLPLSQ